MKTIGRGNVVFHGIEHEQYFQGADSLKGYGDHATGIGDTAEEAIEDALEALSQNDWDCDSWTFDSPARYQREDTVDAHMASIGHDDDCEDDCDHAQDFHYYVTVYVAEFTAPKTHPDVEFHVEEQVFSTFNEAAGLAAAIAASNGRPATIDVCVWTRAGATFYAGDDGAERYDEDPDASVFERIVVSAESIGRVA